MKTLEEVQEQGERRRAEEAGRETAYHAKYRRSVLRLAAAAALISGVSCLLLQVAVREQWWFLLLSPLPGVLSGSIIALIGGGVLRGMLINAALQCGFFISCLPLGGWTLGSGGMEMVGPLIIFFMDLLSWSVVGGLLGYIAEAFEQDHLQI